MTKHLLTIQNVYIAEDGSINVEFDQPYKMRFIAKMRDYIIRNIYYNATGKYYKPGDDLSEVLGKSVIGISNNDDENINQTRPIQQTENQKYRDSEAWLNLKLKVAELRNYTCESCGREFCDKSYEIHHQDYYNGSNVEYTDRNPIHYKLYCRKCHQSVHDTLSRTLI